jgi:glycosyltransferase involved in cell wall biosynthesis
MKKIILYAASLRGGGAERVMVTLANGFSELSYNVKLVLVKKVGEYIDEVSDKVEIVDLECSRVLYSILPFSRYLRNENPEIVVSTQSHVNIAAICAKLLSNNNAKILVREASTPSISSSHAGFRSKVISYLLRFFYNKADVVVCPSNGVSQDLQEKYFFDSGRIKVVPNPMHIQKILKQSQSQEEVCLPDRFDPSRPYIIAVGRLTKPKNFPLLIHAFSLVRNKIDARLVILGEGEDRQDLEALVKELGLSQYVYMPGFVENPFAYMKRSSVFVLSSLWEGLPNVLIQAMIVGTPVVATDCPSGPKQILENGKWGKLVPIGDEQEMANAILDVFENGHEKIPMEMLEKEYSTESVLKKYLECIE